MTTLLLIGLIGSLVFFVPTWINGSEVYAVYFCILSAVSSLFLKAKRSVNLSMLFLIFLIAFFTMLPQIRRPAMVAPVIYLFIGVMAIKSISECFDISFKKLGFFLYVFFVGNTVLMLLQFEGLEHYYFAYYPEITGVLNNPWMLGCVSVLSIPFLSALNPSVPLLLIPSLYFSHSTACVAIAVLVYIVSVFGINKRSLFFGFIFCVLISSLYMVFFDMPEFARLSVWKQTIPHMKNIFIGSGLGSWAQEGFIKANGSDWYYWGWAHNDWFQHFFDQGIIGMVPVLGLVGLFLYKADKKVIATVLAIVFLSMVHPIFHVGKLLVLLVVVISLLAKEQLWQVQK